MRPHPAARVLGFAVAVTVAGLAPVSAQNPVNLPIGKTLSGQATNATPTIYRFNAPAAGVLSIAVHAASDVALTVTDAEGQAVPDGEADRDLFGSGGNEQLIVTLFEAGEYRVQVRMLDSGNTKFDIGAGWIAMPAFARASDPDRRPSLAKAMEPGRAIEDSLTSADGDYWDWFVVTPKTGGTLTVILRPIGDASVDLALELYAASDLTKALVRSDDDLQGNTANESATIDVTSGQKVYAKVMGATGSPTGRYRVTSSLIE
jgi:hypothetical protein